MEEIFGPTSNAPLDVGRTRQVEWNDLRSWLDLMESDGQLMRIRETVDPHEELSAITFLASRREPSPALLFESLSGDRTGSRILSNILAASKERYARTVGLDPRLDTRRLIHETRGILKSRIAPVLVPKASAPVNEVVLRGSDVDITKFPAPKFWPGDGGRYIGTGDITLTRDPQTGRINVGAYRQMVHGPARVGLYCSPGKHGKLDREAWWRRGEPCEVVAAYGIDPVLFLVGGLTIGGQESELDVAGGMMGRPIELAEAEFVSLPIPANAELVIEGVMHADDRELEGPLGEFTGYYGNPRAPQPVIEVKAIHHRRAPIVTAALMAAYPSCEIGAAYSIIRSARIWEDLEKIGLPGIAGVYANPAAASGWGMVIVSIKQQYPGHVAQALALAAQCPAAAYFTKWIIAVDDDVDPTDLNQVMWALSTRCDPAGDVELLRRTWSSALDPSRFPSDARPYGSKALIDACKPHRHLDSFPPCSRIRRSTYEYVARRWKQLGFVDDAPAISDFHPENANGHDAGYP